MAEQQSPESPHNVDKGAAANDAAAPNESPGRPNSANSTESQTPPSASEGGSQAGAAAAPNGNDNPEGDSASKAPDDPAARIATAEAKAKEYYDALLRAKAEFENFKRRSHEDVVKARKFAIESFAEHLLPVVDSLYAALADQSGEIAHLREGVELTLRQLKSAFEKGKLVEIDPAGEKFDPHKHQAISAVPSPTVAPGHVVSVLQKGWMIADRVLRPALVTVSQAE